MAKTTKIKKTEQQIQGVPSFYDNHIVSIGRLMDVSMNFLSMVDIILEASDEKRLDIIEFLNYLHSKALEKWPI